MRRYFHAHPDVKLVVVAGSIGKTSTKTMIATILSQSLRVRMEHTNHNTHMSAPLAILGIEYPANIRNVFTWLAVFWAARRRIRQPSDVDVIVQELGTDRIGEIPHFGSYLHPDIAVVTGVTEEHMEFFGTLDAVASEELSVAHFSQATLINRDDIPGRYASYMTNPMLNTYGTTEAAEYCFEINDWTIDRGFSGQVMTPDWDGPMDASVRLVGEHSLRPVMGAVAVACKLGLEPAAIKAGIEAIRAVPGRMNHLRGVNDSILIDDTYNASPAAAEAALQTLYSINAPQRIAVLGSMNELGESSVGAHERLGELCDPNLLAWVVTVGEEANLHIAVKARARGCQVQTCRTAIEAGAFVHKVLERGGAVLLKGSQGGVYLEEATKMLLHSTEDDHQLVRQSYAWLQTKQRYFEKAI